MYRIEKTLFVFFSLCCQKRCKFFFLVKIAAKVFFSFLFFFFSPLIFISSTFPFKHNNERKFMHFLPIITTSPTSETISPKLSTAFQSSGHKITNYRATRTSVHPRSSGTTPEASTPWQAPSPRGEWDRAAKTWPKVRSFKIVYPRMRLGRYLRYRSVQTCISLGWSLRTIRQQSLLARANVVLIKVTICRRSLQFVTRHRVPKIV